MTERDAADGPGPSPDAPHRSGALAATLRQELADKAAATDELRAALAELRKVLDVSGGPPPSRAPRRHRGLLILLLVLAAITVAVVVLRLRHQPPTAAGTAADAAAGASVRPLPWPGGPVTLPPGLTTTGPGASVPGTDVQVAVDGDGRHLDVIERLLLGIPTSRPLVLTATSLAGFGGVRVDDLQVQLDSRMVQADAAPEGTSWTARAAPGQAYTRAVLRYRIDGGVVEVTPAPAGRAFGVVTPLTALISQDHGDPVVVRAVDPDVIGVSCPAVRGQGSAVCGDPVPGGWAATLPPAARPIVLLQVDL